MGSHTRDDATDDATVGAATEDTLRVDEIEVHQGRGHLLPRTSLEARAGQVTVALGQPGGGHTALALALAGRIPLDHGTVTLGGDDSVKLLQRSVMLVDVPGVTEPEGSIPLHTIVGEELAMAGHKASRAAVRRWLADQGLADHRDSAMDEVPPLDRIIALSRLAALRPDSRFLVLAYPERHGVPPADWLHHVRRLATDGLGVLVTASAAVNTTFTTPVFRIGTEGILR